ncbi:hypothetical protein SAMN05428948_0941 [Massilia sp. CF038]|nr:hypothetical protein SAMN05428948_0941 [Massilia sp. CF038]
MYFSSYAVKPRNLVPYFPLPFKLRCIAQSEEARV